MKKAVAVILLNKNNEFLLHLRDDKPDIPYPNYWALISGEIEHDEIPLEAMKREIKEEISQDIENLVFIGEVYVTHPVTMISIFKAELNEKVENIQLNEGQEINFFKFDEIKNLHAPEFLKKFIYKNKNKILVG